MTGLLIGALLGGLTGSPHCVGMCGGFAVASADAPVAYHLGRLSTYVLLGSLAGAFGAAIPGPPWLSAAVAVVMLAWFSLRLAGVGGLPHLSSGWVVDTGRKLINRQGHLARYALGAVTALLPCGLVWAALGLAVGSNGAALGAAVMSVFWLGTVPLLAAASVGLRRFAGAGPRARIAVAALVFTAGLWSIAQRTPVGAAADDPVPPCHQEG